MYKTYRKKVEELKEAIQMREVSYPHNLNSLTKELFRFVLEEILELKEELQKMRRGTFFSRFSPEEIDVVAKKDPTVSYLMHDLWFEDNQYCMHLDFLYEDFEQDLTHGWTSCKTVEEYREEVDRRYDAGVVDTLEELLEHLEETYDIRI